MSRVIGRTLRIVAATPGIAVCAWTKVLAGETLSLPWEKVALVVPECCWWFECQSSSRSEECRRPNNNHYRPQDHDEISTAFVRSVHDDGRARLTRIWVPSGGITPAVGAVDDAASRLVRAGFVRQAHSGFFHLLPLGLRVQEKLERLIDEHMRKLGASKVSLSTFSSPQLWKKSGRYKKDNPDFFQLPDRKGATFLLSPTHEEEITALVSGIVKSYKQLPVLLYQISRKYRDEPRPRQGLLRTREFLMKDLYTFDADERKSFDTYQKVRKAYDNFFSELRIPILVARADSGDIGGHLNHEYHIATASGEDTIISCTSCNFAYNEELTPTTIQSPKLERSAEDLGPYRTWFGISKDRSHLVKAILPRLPSPREHVEKELQVNTSMIRSRYPDLDLSIERPLHTFLDYWMAEQPSESDPDSHAPSLPRLTVISDYRVSEEFIRRRGVDDPNNTSSAALSEIIGPRWLKDTTALDLARPRNGSECSNCGERSLKVQQAVELGHTFNLGQRYSKPMNATFTYNPNEQSDAKGLENMSPSRAGRHYFSMGCHGIGISRMIAAVADALADERGLIWPRAMAPYEVVILATEEHTAVAEKIWDMLTEQQKGLAAVDAVLDDREKSFGWKLKDADLLGFPVVIVLGSTFGNSELCEVLVRRPGTREKVSMTNLRNYITSRLAKV
ncbi:MAG: hypothetical protein L6R39_000121 [Caloplaca ligustica]|nr:MAG: hypothetical protein L6R39_000121 [Caloplaca ligustica]